MLTKKQSQSLQAALKEFIKLLFTSRHPYTKLLKLTKNTSIGA